MLDIFICISITVVLCLILVLDHKENMEKIRMGESPKHFRKKCEIGNNFPGMNNTSPTPPINRPKPSAITRPDHTCKRK